MKQIGWKTITGAVMSAIGYLLDPGNGVIDMMPASWAHVLIAIGGVLAAIGVRHAIAKATPTPMRSIPLATVRTSPMSPRGAA